MQAPERRDALWIVDGQQRVTSLATVLLPADPVVPTPPALYFDLSAERFVWQRPNGPSDNHLPVREAHKLPNVMAWLRERNLDEPLQERAFKLADQIAQLSGSFLRRRNRARSRRGALCGRYSTGSTRSGNE